MLVVEGAAGFQLLPIFEDFLFHFQCPENQHRQIRQVRQS